TLSTASQSHVDLLLIHAPLATFPVFFSFHHPPTPEIYTLSLHDALPICRGLGVRRRVRPGIADRDGFHRAAHHRGAGDGVHAGRSEEHTSELQSRFDLVCRLLLEKKKKTLCSSWPQ